MNNIKKNEKNKDRMIRIKLKNKKRNNIYLKEIDRMC